MRVIVLYLVNKMKCPKCKRKMVSFNEPFYMPKGNFPNIELGKEYESWFESWFICHNCKIKINKLMIEEMLTKQTKNYRVYKVEK